METLGKIEFVTSLLSSRTSTSNNGSKPRPLFETCLLCSAGVSKFESTSLQTQDLATSLIRLLRLTTNSIKIDKEFTNVSLCPKCFKIVEIAKRVFLEIKKLQDKLGRIEEIVEQFLFIASSSSYVNISKKNDGEIKNSSQLRQRILSELNKRNPEVKILSEFALTKKIAELGEEEEELQYYEKNFIVDNGCQNSSSIKIDSEEEVGISNDNDGDDNEESNIFYDSNDDYNEVSEAPKIIAKSRSTCSRNATPSSVKISNRKRNFTKEEEETLMREYLKYKDLLIGKVLSIGEKKILWENITKVMTTATNLPLTEKECQKKIENLKYKAKNMKKSPYETGFSLLNQLSESNDVDDDMILSEFKDSDDEEEEDVKNSSNTSLVDKSNKKVDIFSEEEITLLTALYLKFRKYLIDKSVPFHRKHDIWEKIAAQLSLTLKIKAKAGKKCSQKVQNIWTKERKRITSAHNNLEEEGGSLVPLTQEEIDNLVVRDLSAQTEGVELSDEIKEYIQKFEPRPVAKKVVKVRKEGDIPLIMPSRAPNYTVEEEELLISEYEKNENILTSKMTHHTTKLQIWANIAAELTEKFGILRNGTQIKKKMDNLILQNKAGLKLGEDEEDMEFDEIGARVVSSKNKYEKFLRHQNFSSGEERTLIKNYIKYRDYLTDKYFIPCKKRKIWDKIAQEIATSNNLKTRSGQQCQQKILNVVKKEKYRLRDNKIAGIEMGPEDSAVDYDQYDLVEKHLFSRIRNEYIKEDEDYSNEVNEFIKSLDEEVLAAVVKKRRFISPGDVLAKSDSESTLARCRNFTVEEEEFLVNEYKKNEAIFTKRRVPGDIKRKKWEQFAEVMWTRFNFNLSWRQCRKKIENLMLQNKLDFENENNKEFDVPIDESLETPIIPLRISIINSNPSNYSPTSYSCLNSSMLGEACEEMNNSVEEYILSLVDDSADLSLSKKAKIVKEFGRFSSVIGGDETRKLGKDFENEKIIWEWIAKNVNSTENPDDEDESLDSITSPQTCFKYIHGIRMDALFNSKEFSTWRASSSTGSLDLKIPLLSLEPSPISLIENSTKIVSDSSKNNKTKPMGLGERLRKLRQKALLSRAHNKRWAARSRTIVPTPGLNPYRCDEGPCCESFPTEVAYLAHASSAHSDNIYPCSSCPSTLSTPLALSLHLKVHGEIGFSLSCSACPRKFKLMAYLKEHMRRTHEREKWRKLSCEVCGTKFRSRAELEIHLAYRHGDEKHPEYKPEILTCTICNVKFHSKTYLRYHMMRHEGSLPHSCSFCPYKSPTKNGLRLHNNSMHSTTRNWQCHLCPNSYKNKKDLDFHLNVHAGTCRKHKCTLCDKEYFCKSKLQKHEQTTHFREDRFCCEICGKKFPVRDHWRNHKRTCEKRNGLKKD